MPNDGSVSEAGFAADGAYTDARGSMFDDVVVDVPEPPVLMRGGFVELAVGSRESLDTGAMLAWFFDLTTGAGACTQRRAGPCVVDDCRHPALIDGRSAWEISAGVIHLYVSPMYLLTFLAGDGTGYEIDQGEHWSLHPDYALHVVAAGAEVPAFDAWVTEVPDLQITSPALGSSDVVLDRTAGTQLAWAPIAAPVRVLLVQTQRLSDGTPTGTHYTEMMVCYFDGRAGGALVPADALADFDAEPQLYHDDAFFAVQTLSQTVVEAGGYTVVIDLGTGGTNAWLPIR